MRKSVIIAAFVAASAISGIVGSVLSGVAGTPDTPKAENCDGCLAGVTSNGALLGSRGVVKTERVTRGAYSVTFKRTVEGCAILATVVDFPDGDFVRAYIMAGLTSDPKVVTYSAFGARNTGHPWVFDFVDVAFTTALICL